MDIEKIVSSINIKYFSGDNCVILATLNKSHIFDESNKIYFMLKGDCTFTLETESENLVYKLTPGEMILIPACLRHSIYKEYGKNEERSQKLWVSFQFDSRGQNILDLFSFPYVIKPKSPKRAERMIETVIDLSRKSTLISAFKLQSAIIELVTYFLEESGAKPLEVPSVSMETIIQYINDNLNHNFSLEDLASMAHMHPTYFIERFKQFKNTTPMKYIMAKRMRHARSLLEHTNLPINRIIEEIGFKDPGHFSRTFKQYYHYSPMVFRKFFYKANSSAYVPKHTSLDTLP